MASILTGCGSTSTGTPASASDDPAHLLAASASLLLSVSSFHVSGMFDPGLSIDLVVSGNGVRGTVTTHAVTWEEIAINGRAYVRSSALWAETEPLRAATLGDQWVAVDDLSAGFGRVSLVAGMRRALGIIVFGAHAGLALTGEVTIDGRRAHELSNATDIYDIAEGTTPYPLRWLDREDPAANGQPCGVTLSDFGAPVTIAAPVATATVTAPPSPAPH